METGHYMLLSSRHRRHLTLLAGLAVLLASEARAQDGDRQLAISHSECTMFGPQREAFLAARKESWRLSALTSQVAGKLPALSTRPSLRSARRAKTNSAASADSSQGFIDAYLFQAMQDAGVTPADPATDFEFIRRVSLDLTGRIPAPDQVLNYVNDSSSDKKARLVDALIAKPEWVDKWTMYFGDLYKNQSNKTTTGTNLYPEGRNAFYKWIKDSVSSNKPYDQMAREIISAEASNTWD